MTMKAIMKVDRSQVQTLKRILADTTLDIGFYKALGFTNYQVLLVGGGGGQSGSAAGYVSANYAGRAGGGGGGALLLSGLLSSLPNSVPVTIGAQGVDGGIAGPAPGTMNGGNGTDGGNTTFNGDSAYGGKGGIGGEVSGAMTIAANYVHAAIGGAGGGNSRGLGVAGAGGTNKSYETSGGSHLTGTATLPTAGTWVDGSGVSGSAGGGGGRGKVFANNYAGLSGASDGAAGATGGDGSKAGPPDLLSNNDGGHGGGVNAKVITGTDEYYGRGPGILIIKFS